MVETDAAVAMLVASTAPKRQEKAGEDRPFLITATK
jgi:hypothetical protein